MPSPTPAFIGSLVKRLGEEQALKYLGRWSEAILMGEPVPRVPARKREIPSSNP